MHAPRSRGGGAPCDSAESDDTPTTAVEGEGRATCHLERRSSTPCGKTLIFDSPVAPAFLKTS